MIIYYFVGSHVHRKDVVHVLDEFDKKYLKKLTFRILHPEEKHTENHMNYHTETPNGATSIALDSKRLIK